MSFTKALANMLMSTNGIRTNCVNPGPVWTVTTHCMLCKFLQCVRVCQKTGTEADKGFCTLQPIIPVSFNEGLVGGFGVGQTPINRCARHDSEAFPETHNDHMQSARATAASTLKPCLMQHQQSWRAVLLRRAAQPKELAPAYVYLASPQTASYVNGEVLGVTGGTPLG